MRKLLFVVTILCSLLSFSQSKDFKISGKIVDNRKNSFPGEVISDFLQENRNFFPKLEEFANQIFEQIKQNNRTRYIALCDYLKS